jgi:hypothetical protein
MFINVRHILSPSHDKYRIRPVIDKQTRRPRRAGIEQVLFKAKALFGRLFERNVRMYF